MIEFAMIMPILALLTFGTMEVTLYLQQQSAINAAAFVGARSASVLGNDASLTKASLKEFTDATGFGWLANARVTQGNKSVASVEIAAGAGRLSGLVSGLTGGQGKAFDELSAGATLPLEYEARKLKSSYSPTSKPMTYLMVSYDGSAPESDVLKNGVSRLRQLKPALESAGRALDKLPNVTGLPNLKVFGHIATGQEPFRLVEAVTPNPKDRKSKGDTPAARSSRYIGPNYEVKPMARPVYSGSKPRYNILNLLNELEVYESNLKGNKGIEETCQQIGSIDVTLPPGPASAVVKAAIAAAKVAAGQAGAGMTQAADKQYRALETKERQLFRR